MINEPLISRPCASTFEPFTVGRETILRLFHCCPPSVSAGVRVMDCGNCAVWSTFCPTPFWNSASHSAPSIGGRFSSTPACSGSGGVVRLSVVQIALSSVSLRLSSQRLLKWFVPPAFPVKSKLLRLPATLTLTGNASPLFIQRRGKLAAEVFRSPVMSTL